MKEFFDAYSVGRPLVIKGWPSKFDGLLSWADLNQLLLGYQLDFPRMRLLREGQILPQESYVRYIPYRRKMGSFRPRLVMDLFNNQLSHGATLVIDDVHEMCPTVMNLGAGMEQVLRERVQVNVYAAWNSARALDLHWDDHDVIAIQLVGKKQWSIYGMTRSYPLATESPPQPEPSSKPVWQSVLEAGDLLYVPRGWWHQVLPLGEPTIHLTFGVYKRTGIDLIGWVTENLRSEDIFRQDLPRFANEEERAEHLLKLRAKFLAYWDMQILERFFRDEDGMAEPRSHAGLPWSLMTRAEDLPEEMRVCLTTSRRIITTVDPQKNTLSFLANGKRWEFGKETGTILQELDHLSSRSIGELCEAAAGMISKEAVRAFLLELLRHGLIAPKYDGPTTY